MKSGKEEPGWAANQVFIAGVLVGSACGLLLGSALGFELRPDRIRALKKMVRRMTSGRDDHPHYDLMV